MVARYGFIDEASGYAPLYWGETTNLPDYAIAGRQFVALDDFARLTAEITTLRARLETVEADRAALDDSPHVHRGQPR